MHRAGAWTTRGGLTRTLLPQTPPRPLEPPGTGRGAEGDGWSAATWAGAPRHQEHGCGRHSLPPPWPISGLGRPRLALVPLSQGRREPVRHPPARPRSAGPASVNHQAVCDSALAPQEAGPHADARDGPGSQAVAGRKQEAPPSQASGLPLGVSPGTPRPPGSSPTPDCQSPPSGPRTPRSAHPPRRDPHLEQCRVMAEQGGRASWSPSWLDERRRPAWQAPGGAGVAGRRAEHGNAGHAWWLQGLALPVGALRAQVCSAGGDLWGRGAGRARTGARGPAGESGGRLSYVAQRLAIPRPPPPGAVAVSSSCSLARVRPDGQSWTTGHRVYPQGEPPNLNSLVSVSGAAGDQCVGLFKHRELEALGAHRGGGRGGRHGSGLSTPGRPQASASASVSAMRWMRCAGLATNGPWAWAAPPAPHPLSKGTCSFS